MGALALLGAACWLIAVIARSHDQAGWHATGRLEWSLTVLAAVALVARGIFLGRPVTARHATAAVIVLFAGIGAHVLSFDLLGDVLIAGSGLALMWPTSARRQPGDLSRMWALINATRGDPLAPFAMQAGKCYLFSADGTAALAYRTRIGYAVVSGDPVGDEAQFPATGRRLRRTCARPMAGGSWCWRAANGGFSCGATRGCSANRCGRYRSAAMSSSTCPTSRWLDASSATCVRRSSAHTTAGSPPRSSPSRTSTTGSWPS